MAVGRAISRTRCMRRRPCQCVRYVYTSHIYICDIETYAVCIHKRHTAVFVSTAGPWPGDTLVCLFPPPGLEPGSLG